MPKPPRHTPSRRKAAETSPPAQALPRAGVFLRLICLVYDGLLLIAMTAVLNTLLIALATPGQASHQGELAVLSPAIRHGLLFPATVLVVMGFYGYCWTRSGQTLGMQTWRLEARRGDGLRMTWSDSLRRFLAAAMVPTLCGLTSWLLISDPRAFGVSVLLGFLFNYLWVWLPASQKDAALLQGGGGRSLHDQLSGTEVLRLPVDPSRRKRYRFLGLFGDREEA